MFAVAAVIESLADATWQVAFDPVWGGPAKVTFPALVDWSTHAEPGVDRTASL